MLSLRHLRLGILTLAITATVLAVMAASGLHVETDLVELLPRTTPGSPSLATTARDMEPLEKVVLVLTLPQGPAAGMDLTDLGCRARDLLIPSDLFLSVRCGWSAKDEDFFLHWILPRSVLYQNEAEVRSLAEALAPDAVAQRLAGLRRELQGITGLLSSPFLRADPLGLAPDAWQLALHGPLTRSLVSRAGDRTLIFASMVDTEDAAGTGRSLRELLSRVSAELSAEVHLPVHLEGIGAPFYAEAYESTIRREVATTITLSAVAIALLLISYFGSLRLPIAVVAGVGAAVTWTGGILFLTHGHLSFIAISMGAILIGLGVDYGIHVGNDMQCLRASGTSGPKALATALRIHRMAILSSAATTFVGFIVLTLSTFRPLRELGTLIPLGISLILLGFTLVTLPILLSPNSASSLRTSPVRRVLRRAVHGVVRTAESHPLAILLLFALVTGVLASGLKRLEFQSDFHLFRPPVPELDQLERSLREDFSLSTGTTRILVHSSSLDMALEVAAGLTDALTRSDPDALPPLSPTPWLLGGKTIREHQQRLSSEITMETVARLRRQFAHAGLREDGFPEFFSTLDAIAQGRPLAAIPREEWPDWLGELVHEKTGEATVTLVLAGDGPVVASRADQAMARFSAPASTRIVLFSLPRVGRAIQMTLRTELRRLMGWSILGICITLLISFRGHLGWTALSLVPAAAGVLWLLGICAWASIPLNLFTVATFPVLVGIGIDDGLHVVHGAARAGSVANATLQRAEAMTMTTLTTMIGFGSLGLSSMPAISRGGPLIAVGVGLCLLLTLTLMPALDRGILRRLRSDRR